MFGFLWIVIAIVAAIVKTINPSTHNEMAFWSSIVIANVYFAIGS